MIIINAILYLSSAWYITLSINQFFIIKILPHWFVSKNIGNYGKYDIFFHFRFTENMIFPQIAENQENVIFTLSVFTKKLFFMKCDNLSHFVAWTWKYFVAWTCCSWKYIFQMQVMFVWARYKSLYIYINTTYVNKNQHCRS